MMRAGSYATSQLGISYHSRSWLCVNDGQVPGPRAGDRPPDGPLGTGRLFECLRPTRFTLLVFARIEVVPAIPPELPADMTVANVDRVTDPRQTLTKRYNAERGALVLVRPDGHIGFRGGADSCHALQSLLRKLTEIDTTGT
jgi:hypothetical protein